MDIGFTSQDTWEEDTYDAEEEIGAIDQDIACYRCGGIGHRAADCGSPKVKARAKVAKQL